MEVGLDYWQVLSHYGEELRELVAVHERAGVEVVVISAVGGDHAGTVEGSVRALGYDLPVHEVRFRNPREAPQLKVAKCLELGVTVFYDDREDVCRALARAGVLAFKVLRRDEGAGDLAAERT